jgi:hypothetical protein
MRLRFAERIGRTWAGIQAVVGWLGNAYAVIVLLSAGTLSDTNAVLASADVDREVAVI